MKSKCLPVLDMVFHLEPSRRARYVEDVPVNAVGLDWTVDLAFARDQIQWRVPVQGNLDPLVLLAGGAAQKPSNATSRERSALTRLIVS
jgi:uroporphyrinogen-III decarboxylase